MKYAVLNLKLRSNNSPILNALLFERNDQNTFGLMFNRSIKKSLHYEKQLLQIIDGKFNFTSVENDDSKLKVFNFKYPFENIKEYIKNFSFTPIMMEYEEKQANKIEDLTLIINKFSQSEVEDIAYIESFQYGSLFERKHLNITLVTEHININDKIRTYLSNDVKTITFTIENLYKNIGLDTIPMMLINKLHNLVNMLVDSSLIPENQLSKVNLAFVNNCVKTVIHLPKTDDVSSKVSHFSNTISEIQTNSISVNTGNQYICTNIYELLKNSSIDELKIIVDDNQVFDINKKQSQELASKIEVYKQEVREASRSEFSKSVIPYEYNTYTNSFMGIDDNFNIYIYYVKDEILNQLWVIKDKIIDANAKTILEHLKSKEKKFTDFKKNIITIQGKYRSKSTADVENMR